METQKDHILIRLSVSDDVGFATNMLEESGLEEGLTIIDMHSDEFPVKDDEIRWFIDKPIPSQPWRKVVSDPQEQADTMEKLRNADSVTVLGGVSGNKSRLRETTMTFLLEALTDPEMIGLSPEKVRVAFQRMPHDREDKPHNRKDGNPRHNLETFKLFTKRLARHSSHIFAPPLHSENAEASLAKAFSPENGKGYTIFDVQDTLARPIMEKREVDITSQSLVIMSPDGANKVKMIETENGKELSIPSAIVFAAEIRNRLYPDDTYDLQADMERQLSAFNQVASEQDRIVKFNDPLFGALPKIRTASDKVETIMTDEVREKVKGKRVLLVDDCTDTAGTFLTVAEALLEAGAMDVDAAVVYPNFASYPQPKKSKTLEDGDGEKIRFTNAMKRALTEQNENGHLLLSDIYSLRTIRNTEKRKQAILGSNEAESERFHVETIANFMLEATLHSIDMAEDRELRPNEDIPEYFEERTNGRSGKMTRGVVMPDGSEYVSRGNGIRYYPSAATANVSQNDDVSVSEP